jgi:hypothetical protein
MKWLIGLLAVQTLLLAIVGLRVIAIDMRTDEIAETADAARLAAQSLVTQAGVRAARPLTQISPALPAAADDLRSQTGEGDEALRLIIREELAAWGASARAAATGGGQQAVTNATQEAAKPYDPAQAVIAQSAFDQEFDRYKASGRISNAEMMELHAKIAELPPDAQRAALIKLTRAINNGEIAGNL